MRQYCTSIGTFFCQILQVHWLWEHEASRVLMEEVEAETAKVWKFIIDREIEAPERFRSIQSYRWGVVTCTACAHCHNNARMPRCQAVFTGDVDLAILRPAALHARASLSAHFVRWQGGNGGAAAAAGVCGAPGALRHGHRAGASPSLCYVLYSSVTRLSTNVDVRAIQHQLDSSLPNSGGGVLHLAADSMCMHRQACQTAKAVPAVSLIMTSSAAWMHASIKRRLMVCRRAG